MGLAPATRYALNNGVHIAYQVVGDGPVDIVLVCGTMSHVDLWWNDWSARMMIERLASFSRFILFDKPGTGLSDPVPGAPTLDQRVDDILAVLDAVGSEQPVVLGYSEGGFPAIVLAATMPHRVRSLVLLSTAAQTEWDEDAPVGPEWFEWWWSRFDTAAAQWGQGGFMAELAPTWAGREGYRSVLGAIERACMSPAMARAIFSSYRDLDVRPMAAAIRVPTLVLHPRDESFLPFALGQDVAARIPGARLVELDGSDHVAFIHNAQAIADAIEEFVTGRRRQVDDDTVVATIVITDHAGVRGGTNAGDGARGRVTLLEECDRRTAALVDAFGGRPIANVGGGLMSSFVRPGRAIRFGRAAVDAAAEMGVVLRVGIHTGECVDTGDVVGGIAVEVTRRVLGLARAGEVAVSSTTHDLVTGAGFEFRSKGEQRGCQIVCVRGSGLPT